jgi:hypothetical protein
MIASKVVCDDTYSNQSWAIVAQKMFSLKEVNQMEREMCGYLEWNLVSRSSSLCIDPRGNRGFIPISFPTFRTQRQRKSTRSRPSSKRNIPPWPTTQRKPPSVLNLKPKWKLNNNSSQGNKDTFLPPPPPPPSTRPPSNPTGYRLPWLPLPDRPARGWTCTGSRPGYPAGTRIPKPGTRGQVHPP